MIPEPIQKFIEQFSKLPSIGPRLATRLAFYLADLDRQTLTELATTFGGLKTLGRCERCFFLTTKPTAPRARQPHVCDICARASRNPRCIAIVERETDLLAIERTGKFNGHYLLLGELPERGMLESMHKLRLERLKARITHELGGTVDELIIAVNLNTFGDFIAHLIREEFKKYARSITRLGRGIPTGGEIEFADEETLGSAIERRV